jgi:hypothetical protein
MKWAVKDCLVSEFVKQSMFKIQQMEAEKKVVLKGNRWRPEA